MDGRIMIHQKHNVEDRNDQLIISTSSEYITGKWILIFGERKIGVPIQF